jgi:hypothetical protein
MNNILVYISVAEIKLCFTFAWLMSSCVPIITVVQTKLGYDFKFMSKETFI